MCIRDSLVSIGLLSGSAMPFDSEVRGMFLGHSLNHTLGHFYRALLEGFSYDSVSYTHLLCNILRFTSAVSMLGVLRPRSISMALVAKNTVSTKS